MAAKVSWVEEIVCGRYALYGPHSRLREQFGVDLAELRERFNIAPTQEAPVVRAGADGEPELIDARWGLLPSWTTARHPVRG